AVFARRYFRRPTDAKPVPSVGIVVPTLGTRTEWLANAVASIELQGEAVELCIVAPPEAVDTLRRRFPGRRVIGEARPGIAAAIEAGWHALAACEIVSWLGDDDELTPDSVRTAVNALLRRPRAAMVYGDYEVVDDVGRRVVTVRPGRWALPFLRLGQNF